jgi:glycosyltransferase 2 family protein
MALRKYLKLIGLSGLAILILWYFGRSLDWAEVGKSLSKANIALLALATFIICFGYLLRAFRWRTLLAPITESDWRELFATTTIGFAAVFLFGRAGEVVRPLWLPMRDPRVRPGAALVTIGVERMCDLAAIILLFALNLLWFRAPGGRDAEFAFVNRIGILLLVCTIIGFIALAAFQRFSAPISIWIETSLLSRKFVPVRLAQLAKNLLNNFVTALQILSKPREFLLVAFWTALLWLSIAIPTWLIILAFDVPFSFSDALFVMGWAVVGSLVPTPGGAAGAFHTATAGALIFMQIDRETAAAVAIIMHLIYFAPALFFGIYYVLRGDVSWARIRSLVITEDSIRSSAAETNETEGIYVLGNARTRKL